MLEIQDARGQIDALRDENRHLRARLEQEIQAKFDRHQQIQGHQVPDSMPPAHSGRFEAIQDPEYLSTAQDFVARMRDKISGLAGENQQIMDSLNHR